MADDRKEDTDFNYWLNVVELLSESSPLLIAQNEKQDRRRDINLGSLRARFPNLKEGLPGQPRRQSRPERAHYGESGRNWNGCLTSARRVPDMEPGAGGVGKRPAELHRSEEYLVICEQYGFTRREDKLQLSGYLHDLGICLHFQDDAVLKQTLILKPKWGTDAVYRVLDDRSILRNRGRLGPKDLARIWSEDKYAPMRDELLRLMMKFQLCYELPRGRHVLFPAAPVT